jgi:hypothetical protein
MALRARLVAPPTAPDHEWPWHAIKFSVMPASALFLGDRRMEAENYLSSGYGLRMAIESKKSGWAPLKQMARSWQPNRLKGILVSRDFGTPFLAATQVFDVRPITRKWLSLDRTEDAKNRFVTPGMILVTCSGSVGRPTLAYDPHLDTLISHDLLRIEAHRKRDWGWIYSFLHAPQTRAMTKGAQYGHIIKHLEVSHLDALPIPTIDDRTAEGFNTRVAQILSLRNEGHRLTLEAERQFERALGSVGVNDWGEKGFTVRASRALMAGRRRIEAAYHNPGVSKIMEHLELRGKAFTTLSEAGYEMWLPSRFRRIPAEDGTLLVQSGDLTEVNPDITKRIADVDFGDPYRGRVEAGWILLARSGQTYGILGTAVLAEVDLEQRVISDDVMRIKPPANSQLRPGYVVTALTHPVLGRPLVKALAYGSSIPHIDVADIAAHKVVRLAPSEESTIAELAEAAAKKRGSADLLEQQITAEAELILNRFIAKA